MLICFVKYEFIYFVIFIVKICELSVKMFVIVFVSIEVVYVYVWDDLIRLYRYYLFCVLIFKNYVCLCLLMSDIFKCGGLFDDGGLYVINFYFIYEARGVVYRVFIFVEDVCYIKSGDID